MRYFRCLVALFLLITSPDMVDCFCRADDSPPATVSSTGSGLHADIFNGRDFNKKVAERVDPNIDFNFGRGAGDVDSTNDDFSIRWTGFIRVPRAGEYRLITDSDDSVRVFIDDKLAIDKWKSGRKRQECLYTFDAKPHAIKVEYNEFTGPARIHLRWQIPGRKEELAIPPDVFFLTRDDAAKRGGKPIKAEKNKGLLCEIFADKQLKRKVVERIDQKIDATFGDDEPDFGVSRDGFSVRWTGWLQPPVAGFYIFTLLHDDGARLWINDRLVIDNWEESGPATITLELQEGTQSIRVEMWDAGGWSEASLHWEQVDGFPETIIPPSAYFRTKPPREKSSRER